MTEFSTIEPDTLMVEDVVDTSCGWGQDVKTGETVRTITVVLLGGPPSIHSGDPSEPLKMMMDEPTAERLRLVLDHSSCPERREREPT